MSMVFVCGNCEMSPCECELQDIDYLNLKLKPGKYYKKLHWREHFFQVDRLGKGYYVPNGIKVSSAVLSSIELVECDKNGKILEEEFAVSRDVNYFGVNYKFVGITHNVNDVSL